jgi:integrase
MIETCRTLGTTQGARFRAFYGCMYFSMMRPSEVAALTLSACELPEDGWGWLTIADASPTAGRAYTDDGQAHEHRGLKGRTRGRPGTRARKPSRRIPAPPELVQMLREHITRFGQARTGASSVPSVATRSSSQRGGRCGSKSGPPCSPPSSLTGRS